MRSIFKLLFLTLLSLVASCALLGGGGPEIQHASGYNFQIPSAWKQADRGDSDHAYRTPSGAIASLTSTCNGHPDASLELLTRHLLIGTRNVRIEKQTHLKIAGVDALKSEVHDTYEGRSFNLMVVVLSKDTCIFDFSLLGEKPFPSKEEKEFLAFVQSFTYGTN